MNDNQELYFNNKKDKLDLGDVPPQKIPKAQNVIQGKDCILIAIVALYMLLSLHM